MLIVLSSLVVKEVWGVAFRITRNPTFSVFQSLKEENRLLTTVMKTAGEVSVEKPAVTDGIQEEKAKREESCELDEL